MAEPKGHPCPQCGAPREPDNSPTCACAQRASDALRDARTAQAAAAEDFNPLRIRPYVALDGTSATQAAADAAPEAGEASTQELPTVGAGAGDRQATPAAEETMTLRPVPPEAAGAAQGDGGSAPQPPATDGTDRTSVLPTPLAPPASAPSDTDLRLFEAAEAARLVGHDGDGGYEGDDGDGGDGTRPRRRRSGLLLSSVGGVVAVIAAAGYASGLFSYDTPSRNTALPSDLRASVPYVTADEASEAAGTSAPPSASQSSASASPSVSESASPSPSPTRSSASPSPSKKPAKPSAAAPTVTATGTLSSDPEDGRTSGGPVLRRGDRGPEVTELQLRLRQLNLYPGDANGNFNAQVEDALRDYQWSRGVETGEGQLGVYGPETRRSLESETREP